MLGQTRALAYLKEKLARRPALSKELEQGRGAAVERQGAHRVARSLRQLAWAVLSLRRSRGEPCRRTWARGHSPTCGSTARSRPTDNCARACLVVAEAFDESGCLIPYGYVEPAPQTLDALIGFAEEAAKVFATTTPPARERGRGRRAYVRMAGVLRVLRVIVQHEIEARPLTAAENRFLAQVVEGCRRVLQSARAGALRRLVLPNVRESQIARRPAAFVSDYYVATSTQTVAYVGAAETRLGVFVVDAGGEPRVRIGPVAHAYERHEQGHACGR